MGVGRGGPAGLSGHSVLLLLREESHLRYDVSKQLLREGSATAVIH